MPFDWLEPEDDRILDEAKDAAPSLAMRVTKLAEICEILCPSLAVAAAWLCAAWYLSFQK